MPIKRWAIAILVLVCCTTQAKPKNITIQDVKYMALQKCLNIHYRALTPEGTFMAFNHDASFLVEGYALANAGLWESFLRYIERETKDFDKLTMSLKNESGKANNVLAQCIAFYESDRLDRYVRNTIMK
ncbi:hypothetical protein [Intestinirhabdus alba]|jgi:hypothetical protein|uniref:Type VI secretion protein n=1 Tax=Intestinirhabdus alba TaxID=2899544 RepID=A0A6L6IRD1_9ENTR|nr:hypothetical protein [Intestinirhabdus alba]MTH47560.1 hypothetical protein [Intestinirhabdus alba]